MGCLKLSYHQGEETLEDVSKHFLRVTSKNPAVDEKNSKDYYAGGFVLRESKTNEESWYKYGYQGEFAERDEETGTYHFESREYDPVISRWLIPDPEGQFASPYNGMGNNWMNGVDPNGELFFGLFGSSSAQRQAARVDAGLWGGSVSNLLRKDISVITAGRNPVMTSRNFGTQSISEVSYSKNGDYNGIDLPSHGSDFIRSFSPKNPLIPPKSSHFPTTPPKFLSKSRIITP